ncbi:MAG: hypothetical protein KTR21_14170 [Rhodobacteraceae bacterium]|nr:hypothetical protein [Paracoccaceae bacterium]
MPKKNLMRMRDFWTALALLALSVFFLFQTSSLPFFNASSAGVNSGAWYNSAALTPFAIFGTLFSLALGLLWVSIRDGGAAAAWNSFSFRAPGWLRERNVRRGGAVSLILTLYIFALVPRVDFVAATALVLIALIYGFHEGRGRPLQISVATMSAASAYALIAHFPQSEWAVPHDDDWVTLSAFAALSAVMWIEVRQANGGVLPGYARAAPLVALLTPLILVCVMAFGFRQNVPNRTGLIFSQIEYHYYVSLRPLWLRKEGE